jgi:hypothetical protein
LGSSGVSLVRRFRVAWKNVEKSKGIATSPSMRRLKVPRRK